LHLDETCVIVQRWPGMRTPPDLMAVHVPREDLGDYNLTEPGWYALDDGDHVILGPFESLPLCERAIRDRLEQQKGA
jgi:hypothetical protein